MSYMIPGDTVLLSLGANDVMNTDERPPAIAGRLGQCLRDIVDTLQEAGLRTALCVYPDHKIGRASCRERV